MASLASERSWLFTPSTMKKVQQCRRLIQMEFGIKLHLTEDTLVEQMNSFAGKSRSDALSRTWDELKDDVPELADTLNELSANRSQRTYRGQPLAEPATETGNNAGTPGIGQPRKTQVIYRGRVVS